jgi:hypothetical protein
MGGGSVGRNRPSSKKARHEPNKNCHSQRQLPHPVQLVGAGRGLLKCDSIFRPSAVRGSRPEPAPQSEQPPVEAAPVSGMTTTGVDVAGAAAGADGVTGVGGPIGVGGWATAALEPNAAAVSAMSNQRRMGESFRETCNGAVIAEDRLSRAMPGSEIVRASVKCLRHFG